jgi:hypothetical protein
MYVVGAPKNVLQMRQEVGGVGRDGASCSCVFYVNGRDYSEENRVSRICSSRVHASTRACINHLVRCGTPNRLTAVRASRLGLVICESPSTPPTWRRASLPSYRSNLLSLKNLHRVSSLRYLTKPGMTFQLRRPFCSLNSPPVLHTKGSA